MIPKPKYAALGAAFLLAAALAVRLSMDSGEPVDQAHTRPTSEPDKPSSGATAAVMPEANGVAEATPTRAEAGASLTSTATPSPAPVEPSSTPESPTATPDSPTPVIPVETPTATAVVQAATAVPTSTPAQTLTPVGTALPTLVTIQGAYVSLDAFPRRFFEEGTIGPEEFVTALDAQYLSLRRLHNGITPYPALHVRYEPSHYGSTAPDGINLGDAAFPGLNSGHHRWEVMAHEQGHNFFGGTSAFYYAVAVPGPLLQESLAVLSAFYSFQDVVRNQQAYGIRAAVIESMAFDFGNGRAYQQARYQEYVAAGSHFDATDVLTSQALDYKMITYGEQYGWDRFRRLAREFQDDLGSRFGFQNDGASPVEQSTYIVAALSVAFERDLRAEFLALNFPIDQLLYDEVVGVLADYVN